MIIFSERLKELRRDKNLSQASLAMDLNVSQRCISGWECGARQPSLENLVSLAKYFDVSVDYLLGLTDFE